MSNVEGPEAPPWAVEGTGGISICSDRVVCGHYSYDKRSYGAALRLQCHREAWGTYRSRVEFPRSRSRLPMKENSLVLVRLCTFILFSSSLHRISWCYIQPEVVPEQRILTGTKVRLHLRLSDGRRIDSSSNITTTTSNINPPSPVPSSHIHQGPCTRRKHSSHPIYTPNHVLDPPLHWRDVPRTDQPAHDTHCAQPVGLGCHSKIQPFHLYDRSPRSILAPSVVVVTESRAVVANHAKCS